MIISARYVTLNLAAYLIEPDTSNHIASQYIENNYDKLLRRILSNKVHRYISSKAEDLLIDVYASIKDDEDNGDGFNTVYGIEAENGKDNIMTVEQFVIGRIRGYANNKKYRSDICDYKQNTKEEYCTYSVTMIPGDNDEDKLNYNQLMYMRAEAKDTITDLIEERALSESINYCIDICSKYGYENNLINILKNIDRLADMFAESTSRVKNSVFSKLTEIAEYNDEFKAELSEIIKYHSKNPEGFNRLIEAF